MEGFADSFIVVPSKKQSIMGLMGGDNMSKVMLDEPPSDVGPAKGLSVDLAGLAGGPSPRRHDGPAPGAPGPASHGGTSNPFNVGLWGAGVSSGVATGTASGGAALALSGWEGLGTPVSSSNPASGGPDRADGADTPPHAGPGASDASKMNLWGGSSVFSGDAYGTFGDAGGSGGA